MSFRLAGGCVISACAWLVACAPAPCAPRAATPAAVAIITVEQARAALVLALRSETVPLIQREAALVANATPERRGAHHVSFAAWECDLATGELKAGFPSGEPDVMLIVLGQFVRDASGHWSARIDHRLRGDTGHNREATQAR